MKRSAYYFSEKDALKDIGKRTVRGGLASIVGQMTLFVLSIGSLAVLARILTPADYGLVGMVTVVIMFAGEFSNFGLVMATVQRREINEAQISTLFWFSVLITAVVAVIVAAIAPLISQFYDRPQLTGITLVLALTVFLSGLGMQHRALIMRKHEFIKLSCIEVSASIISIVVAVIMALKGFGYWALVARQLVNQAALTAGAFLGTGWIPQRPRRATGVMPYISYGGNMMGHRIIQFLAKNVDNVLIGKFVGAAALGYYAQAYRIILMPLQQVNTPLNRPIIATLSRLQDDTVAYRRMYRQFIVILSYVSMTIIAFLAIAAREVVLIILGPEWLAVVPIFLALLPLAYVFSTIGADTVVYSSIGTTNRQLRWSLFSSPIIVLCMLLGLPWETIGVALGASAGWFLLRPFALIYCYKGTPLSLKDYLACTVRPTLIAIAAAILTFLTFALPSLQTISNVFLLIAFKGSLFCAIFLIVDFLIPGHPKFYTLLHQAKNLFAKK